MASNYISPISMDALSNLCQELGKNNYINAHDFERYQVKRGLRNSDGTGVMAGLTRICSAVFAHIRCAHVCRISHPRQQ